MEWAVTNMRQIKIRSEISESKGPSPTPGPMPMVPVPGKEVSITSGYKN